MSDVAGVLAGVVLAQLGQLLAGGLARIGKPCQPVVDAVAALDKTVVGVGVLVRCRPLVVAGGLLDHCAGATQTTGVEGVHQPTVALLQAELVAGVGLEILLGEPARQLPTRLHKLRQLVERGLTLLHPRHLILPGLVVHALFHGVGHVGSVHLGLSAFLGGLGGLMATEQRSGGAATENG